MELWRAIGFAIMLCFSLAAGTGAALAQPGSLQASMAEELDEVEDEGKH
jgi:hypothetical protein